MDIEDIAGDLRYISTIGITLNLDERLQLDLALCSLSERENFEQVKLWGKINGTIKDYYIAQTLNFKGHIEFPHKRFFWCSSGNWIFAELPKIQKIYIDIAENMNQLFTGEHDKILFKQVEQKNFENEEIDEMVPPPKNFTELDRVSYVVRTIEDQCQLVPVGAFKLTTDHELRPNCLWKGVDPVQVTNLQSYQHFRPVQSQEKREMIDREEALYQFDFLDAVETDIPIGQWCVRLDSTKSVVNIRSILWPGYIMFHKIGTTKFGAIYIGEGVKNSDLPFLL